MKNLLILALALLCGCATTYEAETTNPVTGSVTTLSVKSHREFPGGIQIYYDKSTGQFELKAGEVTSGGQADAIRDVVLGVLPLIQPVPDGG